MVDASVTSGWSTISLDDLLKEVDVRVRDLPPRERQLEVLSLTKRWGLVPQSERFEKRIATDDVGAYKVVRSGWIVYNPFVIWEGAIHALRRAKPGIVSPVYAVWQRTVDDGGFVDLLLRTPEMLQEYQRLSAGAVNRRRSIRKPDFLSIRVSCPPLREQRQIAKVLWTVRRAVERQEHLITLTAELRNAVLRSLITEGTGSKPPQQTEIGPLAGNWKLERLASLYAREPSNGIYRRRRTMVAAR